MPKSKIEKIISELRYDSPDVDYAYRKVFIPTKNDEKKLQELSLFPVYFDGDENGNGVLYFIYGRPDKYVEIQNYLKTRVSKLYSLFREESAKVNSFITHFLTEIQDISFEKENTITGFTDARIVQMEHTVILDAIAKHASDIHIEIFRKGQVRFRVNGMLRVYTEMSVSDAQSLIRTFLNDAQLDVSDLVTPQDGMFQKRVAGEIYSFRVNTIGVFTPTGYSVPTMVMRILYKNSNKKLENLGFEDSQLHNFKKMINREGIIVITGPTGSGKTTTLYALLDNLALNDKKVVSVEDPPEIASNKVTQIKIMPERGITWEKALQDSLRMDPDIILIGEIRSRKAAEIVMQAAITGHTVLTTIHTNGVESIVERFIQIAGKDSPTVNAQTLAYSLIGLVSQRLVKKIRAKVAVPLDTETRKKLSMLHILDKIKQPCMLPDGTVTDENTYKGYDMTANGRTVVAEVVNNNADFMRVLRKKDPSIIRQYLNSKKNHITLTDHAIMKVNRGEVSLFDIMPYIANTESDDTVENSPIKI